MKYLIEETPDGIGSSGDPVVGAKSEFSIAAESIRLEAEHDAATLGEDPQSLPVRLDIANRIAVLRLSLFCERNGFTQAEVAGWLNCSRGHLNRVLNGKGILSYELYQDLRDLEVVTSILDWVDRKAPAERAHFETLLSGVRICDRMARIFYCLAATFGKSALQDWADSTGTMTPIPAEQDAPEALNAALRKVVV